MSHTYGNLLLHFIFSTHERRPLIKPDFRADLFAYLGGIVREMHGTALIVNGTEDHVHMLVRIRPTHSAAEIARVVKTNSSGWVREKWSTRFAWQAGYGVFSVSESNASMGRNILPRRRSITRNGRSTRNLRHFSRRMGFRTTRGTSADNLFRPSGAGHLHLQTHGWRRGLDSSAASRLRSG